MHSTLSLRRKIAAGIGNSMIAALVKLVHPNTMPANSSAGGLQQLRLLRHITTDAPTRQHHSAASRRGTRMGTARIITCGIPYRSPVCAFAQENYAGFLSGSGIANLINDEMTYLSPDLGISPRCRWVQNVGKNNASPATGFTFRFCRWKQVSPPSATEFR